MCETDEGDLTAKSNNHIACAQISMTRRQPTTFIIVFISKSDLSKSCAHYIAAILFVFFSFLLFFRFYLDY